MKIKTLQDWNSHRELYESSFFDFTRWIMRTQSSVKAWLSDILGEDGESERQYAKNIDSILKNYDLLKDFLLSKDYMELTKIINSGDSGDIEEYFKGLGYKDVTENNYWDHLTKLIGEDPRKLVNEARVCFENLLLIKSKNGKTADETKAMKARFEKQFSSILSKFESDVKLLSK